MQRYGFRYGTDNGEMGSGYWQEEFKAKDDRSARRCFGQRVRRLKEAARKRNGIKLWGNQELHRLYPNGPTKLLISLQES